MTLHDRLFGYHALLRAAQADTDMAPADHALVTQRIGEAVRILQQYSARANEPSGTWFGPYDTAERARMRREHLRRHGDSLGVKLARGARIVSARYTSDGIEWDR